jgi:hypothetical protein
MWPADQAGTTLFDSGEDMQTTTLLEPETADVPHGGSFEPALDIKFRRGVAQLIHGLGERAITVEATLDFDNLVKKEAVVFPGASDASLGFRRVHVDAIDVWWRQRLLLAKGQWRLSVDVRPRRLVVSRMGRALSAVVDYRVRPAGVH